MEKLPWFRGGDEFGTDVMWVPVVDVLGVSLENSVCVCVCVFWFQIVLCLTFTLMIEPTDYVFQVS